MSAASLLFEFMNSYSSLRALLNLASCLKPALIPQQKWGHPPLYSISASHTHLVKHFSRLFAVCVSAVCEGKGWVQITPVAPVLFL